MKYSILILLVPVVLFSCQSRQDKAIKEVLAGYSKIHYENESDNPFLRNKWVCLSDTLKFINGDVLIALDFTCSEMNNGGNTYPYTNYGSFSELLYMIDPFGELQHVGLNAAYEYIYQNDRIAIYERDDSGRYISLREANYSISNDSLRIDQTIFINHVLD